MDITSMKWTREPLRCSLSPERIEITTRPHTDLWQRTYYHFRNDNAPVLQTQTDRKFFSFVVKTDFSDSHHRFDQCGVVLYLDAENWLKASVEYENERFGHLGSVVTNHGYSDWATTAIPADVRTMWYRLSRREDDYRIECSPDGRQFTQMRVCHLWEGAGTIRFGIYACSPEASSFRAVFTDLAITECAWKAHDGQQPDSDDKAGALCGIAMKTIRTDGITHIVPVPDGTAEWYYGLSCEQGDLYEAETIFRSGGNVPGNALCLIHDPDGAVYRPVPGQPGTYFGSPVFLGGRIYILQVDFVRAAILIHCFDCETHQTEVFHELPLGDVKNCYNLQLHTAPLCLTRQGDDDRFEIIWPERVSFAMDPHESFFLRSGETLFFNRWYEEGEGPDYRYWETTVARDLNGNQIEILPGDLRVMPDGALWHIV